MAYDSENQQGGWLTFTARRVGLGRVEVSRVSSHQPPAAAIVEDWPQPERLTGPPVRVEIFACEASATWVVYPGIQDVPHGLATNLLTRGRARLATGEPLSNPYRA